MYQLFYYPRNASFAPHLVIKELGVDYELVLVDRKSNAQKSDEYIKLNPTGRIPTLVDNGSVIHESAAICLHLCEQNPQSKLIPELGSPSRTKFYQWLFYLNATLQPELMIYFYPSEHTTELAGASAISEAQELRVMDIFSIIDIELQGKQFLVGEQPTICDYFLFMLSHWAKGLPQPPLSLPNLGPYLRELAKRQAVIDVCQVEGTSLDVYQ